MELEPNGDELDASWPECGPRPYANPNEDDEDEGDDEPSLGSHEIREGGAVSYLHHAISAAGEMIYDCEGDEHDGREPEDDSEPSLCGGTAGLGWDKDLEIDLGSLDRQMDQRRSLTAPRLWCAEDGECD